MSSWNIIGWMILTAFFWGIAISVYNSSANYVRRMFLHLRSRNIKPEEGQRWNQEGSILEIYNVLESGRLVIRHGCATWGEDIEDWKRRVNNRRLWLVSSGRGK